MEDRSNITAEKNLPAGFDIEGAILDGLDDDPRFGHGVPEHLKRSDIDFIQMSGLTAASGPGTFEPPPPDSDLDPSMPVSFYEEGVDDVDSRRTPLGTEIESGAADEVILPRPRTAISSSIESLKEIVADLAAGESRRARPHVPAPERPAAVHASAAFEPGGPDIAVPDEMVSIAELPDDPPSPSESPPAEIESVARPNHTPPAAPETETVAPRYGAPPAAPANTAAPNLLAAESLLQQLEARTGLDAPNAGEDFGIPEIPEATVHDADAPETDESVYNRPNSPARRHGKRRRGGRRRFLRYTAAFLLVGALGAGGYYAYAVVRQQTATETDLYRGAMRLAERGPQAEAGAAFAALLQRFPESPLAPDAHLMAARSFEQAGDLHSAVQHYEQFREAYPDHPKYHRATTLLALSYVRAGEFEKAISLLQNPERRALDSDGYLPSLRALGQAHAALGQIDEARSAYLRAASLEGNYTADEDYLALATLYQEQAEHAPDAESRTRYLSLTVDQWDFAMRSPGIIESRRRDIKARRDLLIGELGNAALGQPAAEQELAPSQEAPHDAPEHPLAPEQPGTAEPLPDTEMPHEN